MPSSIRERSLGYFEIFSSGFEIFKDNIATIAAIDLAVFIPVSIIFELIVGWGLRPLAELYAEGQQPTPEAMRATFSQIPLANWMVTYGVLLLVSTIAFPLVFMAICYVVEQSILGDRVNWQEALRQSSSRLGSAIGTNLLFGVFVALWSLLFVVGSLIPLFYYQYSTYVVALRGKGGGKALKHSSDLVKKRSGITLLVVFTIAVANVIVTNVLSNLMQPQVWGSDWVGLLYTILTYLISALFITLHIVLFLNVDYERDRETVQS